MTASSNGVAEVRPPEHGVLSVSAWDGCVCVCECVCVCVCLSECVCVCVCVCV